MCNSIVPILVTEDADLEFINSATRECKKIEELFGLYGKCHNIFNSAQYLTENEIAELGKTTSVFSLQSSVFSQNDSKKLIYKEK